MPESLRTRLHRWYFNHIPAYRGTGGKLTYLADDFREIRVQLPLNRRTRNYVGTIFGGSMYGAVDPVYMVMLIKNLGPEYQVWDKAATIRFRKPGRGTLYARFVIDERELGDIHQALADAESTERVYDIDLTDDIGVVHATIRKTIHIRRKRRQRSEGEPQAAERPPEVNAADRQVREGEPQVADRPPEVNAADRQVREGEP